MAYTDPGAGYYEDRYRERVLRNLRRRAKSLGFVLVEPDPHAGQVLANFASLMRNALLATTAGTPIEVWFQDEARVGQKGSLTYVWAPIGSCPRMVRDNRHDSAYLFGAICPARAVGAAIIMPAANAEAMNKHLTEISTQVASGAHAVVVCDKAGWHQTGRRLRVPDNITLLPLPSYAPELNPMENVWEYLRGNKLT
jgi:hypothetical protein